MPAGCLAEQYYYYYLSLFDSACVGSCSGSDGGVAGSPTRVTDGTVTVTFWVDAVYLMYLLLGLEARFLKFSMNLARSFLCCRERGLVIALKLVIALANN